MRRITSLAGAFALTAAVPTAYAQLQPGFTPTAPTQPTQIQPAPAQPGFTQPVPAQSAQPQPAQVQPGRTLPGQAPPGQPQTAQARPINDNLFLGAAYAGGLSEITVSQMALRNAGSEAVRSYAETMVNDHTKANQQIQQLSAVTRGPLPTTLGYKDQAVLDALAGLSGESFDRAYLKQQEAAHLMAITVFQAASERAQVPQVREFAGQTVATLQQHLQNARSLQGAGGSPTADNSVSTSSFDQNEPVRVPASAPAPEPAVTPSDTAPAPPAPGATPTAPATPSDTAPAPEPAPTPEPGADLGSGGNPITPVLPTEPTTIPEPGANPVTPETNAPSEAPGL